jgi:hypothetical protein
MSKIVKSVSWTSPKGAAIEVKIEISKSLEKDISYSDGWNVDLGNKVVESKVISVYIDGKYCEKTYNNPSIVEGICYSPDYIKKVKAAGYYAKLTDTVVISEEKYNLIMAEIAAAEAQIEIEFKVEQPEAVKAEEEKKSAAVKKEIETKMAWAEKIMAEVAIRKTEILSAADEKLWRTRYNNINNEGGEGYVPRRATLEDIARAKEILAGGAM